MLSAPHERAAGFLVAAASEPDAWGGGERVRAAARAVPDWGAVVELAARHGVAAYAGRAVRAAGIDAGPAEPALRAVELSAVATTLHLQATLAQVMGVFKARAIEALVLKGPILARSLYPEPSLRPYGDIDLVLRPAQLEDGVAALIATGFREVPYAAEVARHALAGAAGGAPFQRTFVDDSGRSLVEVHADPLQLGLHPRAEEDRWRRAVAIPTVVPHALALGDEDALVQLCVHAQKHGFDRLIWLKDLDLFVRRRGAGLDWDLIAATALQEGLAASVWYALALARSILGTPRTPAEALAPAPPIRALYELVWPRGRVRSLRTRMRRRAVQFHAAESWRGMLPSIVLMGRRRDRVGLLLRSLRSARPRSTDPQPRANAVRTA